DGIRDFHVTGVQTCAPDLSASATAQRRPARSPAATIGDVGPRRLRLATSGVQPPAPPAVRSPASGGSSSDRNVPSIPASGEDGSSAETYHSPGAGALTSTGSPAT